MHKRKKINYYILYTLIFICLFILCFGIYLIAYKKSFFRLYDGFDQHYVSFLYLGRWGRSIVKNLFLHHKLVIPLWNQAIGYGADIPTSLGAYLWDPFNWISFFIPSRYSELGYDIMIISKFYACGIAYSIFAFHRKHSPYAVLCGAIIYTFSAVNYVGFYQSFFINPLIIFPLLITGADLLFDENKSICYVAMLAISFISYFYFAYMMCIFIFCYCIIKLIFNKDMQKSIKNVTSLFMRFLLNSIIAVGISAVSLLPMLIVILQAGRLNVPHYLPLLFQKEYYAGLIKGWTTSYTMLGRDCIIGWGVIALVCTIVLFLHKKSFNQIKTEFILMTAGLCIPMFGHIMNGMNYTANRWVWAYDLLIALIVTIMVPELKKLSSIQRLVLLIVSLLYIIVCSVFLKADGRQMMIVALLILLIVALCYIFPKLKEKQFQVITILISAVCVISSARIAYSKYYKNGFGNHTSLGKAYSSMTLTGGMPLLKDLNISDGSRFDTHGLYYIRNNTMTDNVSGINFYISIYNNNIDQFHSSVAMRTNASCYSYHGLDRRSELEALLGVNHYFVNGENISKPVGFDHLEAQREIGGIPEQSYRANKKNSLFYTFDKKISYQDYNKLSHYERQQALMQACVVDHKYKNTSVKKLHIQSNKVQFKASPYKGVTIDHHKIKVAKNGGQIELRFSKKKNAEMYLYFHKIFYKNGEAIGYKVDAQGYQGNKEINNLDDSFNGYTYYNNMYGGKSDWLLNLGTTGKGQKVNKIIITFCNAGTYSLKDMKLYARSVKEIKKNILGLQRKVSNVQSSDNSYSCKVNTKKRKTLFTSIPYSNGWKAYDKGKEIPIQKTDVAFMSLNLSKGSHHIVFIYRTPGLYLGLAITACSLGIYILLEIRKKHRDSE